ncbi:hypothetical protein EDC01DRAFT_610640, partial [Geopyxis carbonaria]
KTLDVLTLFHAPQKAESTKVLSVLRSAITKAEENSLAGKKGADTTFQLEVVEAPNVPTASQLKSILEYVGANKVGQIVQGARNEKDAVKILEEGGPVSSERVLRPLLVDWNNGRAVLGADEKAIQNLVDTLPK